MSVRYITLTSLRYADHGQNRQRETVHANAPKVITPREVKATTCPQLTLQPTARFERLSTACLFRVTNGDHTQHSEHPDFTGTDCDGTVETDHPPIIDTKCGSIQSAQKSSYSIPTLKHHTDPLTSLSSLQCSRKGYAKSFAKQIHELSRQSYRSHHFAKVWNR